MFRFLLVVVVCVSVSALLSSRVQTRVKINGFKSPEIASNNMALKMADGDYPVQMAWVNAASTEEFDEGTIINVVIAGLDIAIMKDMKGKFFAVADKSPYLNVPLSYGEVCAGSIKCPQSKTEFDLDSGKVVGDWIPWPPVLNNALRILVGPPADLIIYKIRNKGKQIQVEVDLNQKERFESKYWRGLLDAQGKENGEYY
jgi:nitrite reductase/ring-hydroxylating ferredoxin subunit